MREHSGVSEQGKTFSKEVKAETEKSRDFLDEKIKLFEYSGFFTGLNGTKESVFEEIARLAAKDVRGEDILVIPKSRVPLRHQLDCLILKMSGGRGADCPQMSRQFECRVSDMGKASFVPDQADYPYLIRGMRFFNPLEAKVIRTSPGPGMLFTLEDWIACLNAGVCVHDIPASEILLLGTECNEINSSVRWPCFNCGTCFGLESSLPDTAYKRCLAPAAEEKIFA